MSAPIKIEDPATRSVELVSPGLAGGKGLGAAYELKFRLTAEHAAEVEAWARANLTADAHGDGGSYRVTSVYCDTPHLDVFHRSPRFRRSKFRLRRYDSCANVFLERKTKTGDRVRKRRCEIPADQLEWLRNPVAPADWPGIWFYERIRQRLLRPTACVTYRRMAFFGTDGGTPVRMTIDRDLLGIPATQWHIPHVTHGHALLPDAVLLELKFHVALPPLYRDLLQRLPNEPARASKYRRSVELGGILPSPSFNSGNDRMQESA